MARRSAQSRRAASAGNRAAPKGRAPAQSAGNRAKTSKSRAGDSRRASAQAQSGGGRSKSQKGRASGGSRRGQAPAQSGGNGALIGIAVAIVVAVIGVVALSGADNPNSTVKLSPKQVKIKKAKEDKKAGMASYYRAKNLWEKAKGIGFGGSGYNDKCKEVLIEVDKALALLRGASSVLTTDRSLTSTITNANRFRYQTQKGMQIE